MKNNSFFETLIIARHFIATRCRPFVERAELEAHQVKRIKRYLKDNVSKANFYIEYINQPLAAYPLMDKAKMMENFASRNTENLTLEQLMPTAIQAESSRNFNPKWQGLTVGLSSGTSGQRGLFVVSKSERIRWAGILLAKALPKKFLWQILQPWKPKLRVAFFLRANSNLYNTLKNSRIDFQFFDLLQPIEQYIETLNQFSPQVLVAPASLLQALANAKETKQLNIAPEHIVNVAEVLETTVSTYVEKIFARKPHQIYQATEGFLAYTCKKGNLHLNESHIYFEKQWLDDEQKRFYPIITDFSRTTQLILRYQLNDILRVADTACECGSAETTISSIEGRSDEIFWLPEINQSAAHLKAIYPDTLRRCMMLVEPELNEYKIIQRGSHWQVAIRTRGKPEMCVIDIQKRIAALCTQYQLVTPLLSFCDWQPDSMGAKCRRLICAEKE